MESKGRLGCHARRLTTPAGPSYAFHVSVQFACHAERSPKDLVILSGGGMFDAYRLTIDCKSEPGPRSGWRVRLRAPRIPATAA